jgi:DNA-binding transcriptional regulator YiaG
MANNLAEQLVRQRTSLGLSQKESARRLGIDPSTLASWEQGKKEPVGALSMGVKRFLQDGQTACARRTG